MTYRLFSTVINSPIIVTNSAWNKMADILKKQNLCAFLFSAEGGGCNGFNYNLETIHKTKFDEFHMSKISPSVITNKDIKLMIEPTSEMLLLGTTIDYIEEDYKNNIFENKFTFTPKKELATTCGCGLSFTPREFNEN